MTKDLGPLLVCRLECPPDMCADLDEWMPKHFDDALDDASVTMAAGYRVHQDFAAESGWPWVLNGHGNRLVAYAADSVDGLLSWLNGDEARRSIEDGADRESKYPLLDAEPFTGNIYEGECVSDPLNAEFHGESPVLVERFEVGEALRGEFSEWLKGAYLESWSEISFVRRVRTFRQVEDLPRMFPYSRYASKGNFMLWVDLDGTVDPQSFVRDERVKSILAQSLPWDLRLPYVRREFADNFVIRNKLDAQRTFSQRRKSGG